MNIIAAIQNTISISQFNRGLAGKIFQDVKNSGAKVVMKNNAPECVLLSPDEYVSLMDEVNDARLLTLAGRLSEVCAVLRRRAYRYEKFSCSGALFQVQLQCVHCRKLHRKYFRIAIYTGKYPQLCCQ